MSRRVVSIVVALALAASTVHARGLFYADQIAIYDATGKKVGDVQTTQAHTFPALATVVFRSGTRPVIVNFLRDEIRIDVLFFASADCTGRPFVDSQGWPGYAYPASAVAGARRTIYLRSGEFRARTVGSILGTNGECFPGEGTGLFAPVTSTDIHLADHFTAPFSARPRGTTAVPAGAP